MIRRREFIGKTLAGMASAGVAGFTGCSFLTGEVSLTPKLAGHKEAWLYVGSKDWSQDDDGIIYSPVWNQCIAKKGGNDTLKREDFAYPASTVLGETDLSMEFRTYAWSVITTGIVFRAQDSARYYVVEFSDMERKGPKYSVRLFRQDASGYRQELAAGFADHPELPEQWVQRGPTPEEWERATPGWARARVHAQGDQIRVLVNDQVVLETKDGTYSAGLAGIVARGPVTFRNLRLSGKRGKLDHTWRTIAEERPAYTYPLPDPEERYGNHQAYPGIFRAANGDLAIWMGVNGPVHAPDDTLLIWSRDEGKTWGEPTLFKKRLDIGRPHFFFGHQDGRLSCLYVSPNGWASQAGWPKVAYSNDGGKTWTDPKPLIVSGKPLSDHAKQGTIGPYSPITRYSDGTLLQYFYHVQTIKDGDGEATNAERLDRSLVIRSTDDGKTWTGPYYLDPNNTDSNETMGAERADGSIVAFSRTLRSSFMWMSTSPDKGLTWTKQVQSNCTGECPYLLRHSSGVLIMGSRGYGIFMKTSTDEGKTWSRETRISLCSGMMGMTEMKDGRVLVVFHEAYRRPTHIRIQYMRVEPDGQLQPA